MTKKNFREIVYAACEQLENEEWVYSCSTLRDCGYSYPLLLKKYSKFYGKNCHDVWWDRTLDPYKYKHERIMCLLFWLNYDGLELYNER